MPSEGKIIGQLHDLDGKTEESRMMTRHRDRRNPRNSLAMLCLLSVGALSFGCGGGGTSGPPPPPDFSLSVNPSALSITAGTVSPAIAVAVSGQNGFADTVNVNIQGLPAGVLVSPPTPLAIPP